MKNAICLLFGPLKLVAFIVCLRSIVALHSLSLTAIHQAQRGSLEDRGREGSIALVSGLKLKAVSTTGLGWLWQSRGSIKGPTLIYNSVSV